GDPHHGARPAHRLLHDRGGRQGGLRRHEASRRARAVSPAGPARAAAPRRTRGGMKTPMTKRGADLLKEELHRLKTLERPANSKAIGEARAHGDLSENAEYHAARERAGFIEGRISELESKLANAQVIDPKLLHAEGKCVFGATVEVEEAGGQAATWQI